MKLVSLQKTLIAELKNGKIKNYKISPDSFGISKYNIEELSVKNTNESLTMMKSVLDNNDNAAKAIVSINAGGINLCCWYLQFNK